MKLVIDSREQKPLVFPKLVGVETVVEGLGVGDYGAWHEVKGQMVRDTAVWERKGLGDLFSSFTSGYLREKAKWSRAHVLGFTYLLAIEGTVSEVLAGHTYWAGGRSHTAQKSGLTMLKQLCTVQRKYGVSAHFFSSRSEMALYIQEYFLAWERVKPDAPAPEYAI